MTGASHKMTHKEKELNNHTIREKKREEKEKEKVLDNGGLSIIKENF